MDNMYSGETQYLNLISHILDNGTQEEGRNGTTISSFGHMMRFSLRDGTLPLITTKRVAWKTCFRELMWFIRGQTDNAQLNAKQVHIWDANASPEFLQTRGLEYREGLLGPIYGWQWRNFNGEYNTTNAVNNGAEAGAGPGDQLASIIAQLKDPAQRSSRRLVMSAWNPLQLDQMALPPCHVLAQFHVRDGKYLSCALYQRSGDMGLGVPFNIASYSFLTYLLAHHCGLVADEFVHFLGDAHIYVEHVDALKEQVLREPFAFPKIEIKGDSKMNIEEYDETDVVFLEPYLHHPPISMPMIA
jgi:thymidylate synthase